MGGILLGWRTVCAVEIDAWCRGRLLDRQREDCLPLFPIWDDINSFDGKPWRGRVDVVSGGFPCQDISCAGKGAGITGGRSGLWREMGRIIGEVRPRFAFVENSPALVNRGLGTVLGDLAALGFDAEWGVLGADDAGAPHRRKRIWIVATDTRHRDERKGTRSEGREDQQWETKRGEPGGHGKGWMLAHADGDPVQGLVSLAQPGGHGRPAGLHGRAGGPSIGGWWEIEPRLGRVAHGVAHRVDRLRAIGNGQVPAVAALAWQILSGWPESCPEGCPGPPRGSHIPGRDADRPDCGD